MLQAVRLKNGVEEADAFVRVAMMGLTHLMNEQPTAFYDLVMKCRDGNYKWFGDNEQICKDLSMVQPDGKFHDSWRNVILSGVVGDDLDMKLVNPVGSNNENRPA